MYALQRAGVGGSVSRGPCARGSSSGVGRATPAFVLGEARSYCHVALCRRPRAASRTTSHSLDKGMFY